jgi:uncharacterized membrane protein YfcA
MLLTYLLGVLVCFIVLRFLARRLIKYAEDTYTTSVSVKIIFVSLLSWVGLIAGIIICVILFYSIYMDKNEDEEPSKWL